jgi:tRNA (mo5U34)-methyltransferase
MNSHLLQKIKAQKWFYEFSLPDGTKTESYLPEDVRLIHRTREKALRMFLGNSHGTPLYGRALDVSCHEGFYSHVLGEYFADVTGIDKNSDSLAKARQMAECLARTKVKFVHSAIEDWPEKQPMDFVLCFGLLYHVENPIEVMRSIAGIAKKAICIETQVLPVSIQMQIEDGSYRGQRESQGLFGLCFDYPTRSEGGRTELAMVPSRDALVSLLGHFGFGKIRFFQPAHDDYEQFSRGHRVILCAEKTEANV